MSEGQMNKNKIDIISAIMSNQNILKCIKYKENTVDILSLPNLDTKDKVSIRKNNIFNFRKVPSETSFSQEVYLSLEYGDIYYMGGNGSKYSISNKYFKVPNFNIYIIASEDLDGNEIIGSRVDRIEEELCNIFHGKDVIGDFGRSYIYTSVPLNLPKGFLGRQVVIKFVGKNG